ncbi:hypothetical protein AKJ56_00715 [candidate division MSBL1 archaeon SCGC-AAA382N08]|uniref:Uncharacterized protein n=1 Tax=candidate division MSBL1 archaeon SCGC-AAA382N08 TaxID=1698285 RepID=A0A133VQ89_9EURY|nr:hypothetical protein AKJ56_00715 [candidate division MSBL1 archaeon SCGC-AAA382N08]
MKKQRKNLKMIKLKSIIILGLVVLTIGIIGLVNISEAQGAGDSEIVLTWEADSFYPADYKGKAAAVFNSSVSVSATILRDGKFVDASDLKFFWYLDNKFYRKGVGLNEINFDVEKLEQDEYFLRMAVVIDGERVENSITIPTGGRELVIENPHPSNFVKLGEEVHLEAIPYFFNVNSLNALSFSWSIDNVVNKQQKANSLILNIGDANSLKGTNVLVTGMAVNKNNPTESARSNLRLKIR